MNGRRLISAVCVVLASLLVIGQTLQGLGSSTSDSKEATQARKKRRGQRQGSPRKLDRRSVPSG
jgi:hypothetical protein